MSMSLRRSPRRGGQAQAEPAAESVTTHGLEHTTDRVRTQGAKSSTKSVTAQGAKSSTKSVTAQGAKRTTQSVRTQGAKPSTESVTTQEAKPSIESVTAQEAKPSIESVTAQGAKASTESVTTQGAKRTTESVIRTQGAKRTTDNVTTQEAKRATESVTTRGAKHSTNSATTRGAMHSTDSATTQRLLHSSESVKMLSVKRVRTPSATHTTGTCTDTVASQGTEDAGGPRTQSRSQRPVDTTLLVSCGAGTKLPSIQLTAAKNNPDIPTISGETTPGTVLIDLVLQRSAARPSPRLNASPSEDEFSLDSDTDSSSSDSCTSPVPAIKPVSKRTAPKGQTPPASKRTKRAARDSTGAVSDKEPGRSQKPSSSCSLELLPSSIQDGSGTTDVYRAVIQPRMPAASEPLSTGQEAPGINLLVRVKRPPMAQAQLLSSASSRPPNRPWGSYKKFIPATLHQEMLQDWRSRALRAEKTMEYMKTGKNGPVKEWQRKAEKGQQAILRLKKTRKTLRMRLFRANKKIERMMQGLNLEQKMHQETRDTLNALIQGLQLQRKVKTLKKAGS